MNTDEQIRRALRDLRDRLDQLLGDSNVKFEHLDIDEQLGLAAINRLSGYREMVHTGRRRLTLSLVTQDLAAPPVEFADGESIEYLTDFR